MHNALLTRTCATLIRRLGHRVLFGALLLATVWSGGCAALSNPVADGIPVSRLPDDIRGKHKDDERTIPLTMLRQRQPDAYRLAPGDVLGIWIEGVTTD